MTEETVTAYLKLVFPDPSNPKDLPALERLKRNRRTALLLFTKGKGNDLPGIAGTLWAAYNGVAEMVDLGRNRRTRDQHLEHIWFGSGCTLKMRAFEIAQKQMKVLADPGR